MVTVWQRRMQHGGPSKTSRMKKHVEHVGGGSSGKYTNEYFKLQ